MFSTKGKDTVLGTPKVKKSKYETDLNEPIFDAILESRSFCKVIEELPDSLCKKIYKTLYLPNGISQIETLSAGFNCLFESKMEFEDKYYDLLCSYPAEADELAQAICLLEEHLLLNDDSVKRLKKNIQNAKKTATAYIESTKKVFIDDAYLLKESPVLPAPDISKQGFSSSVSSIISGLSSSTRRPAERFAQQETPSIPSITHENPVESKKNSQQESKTSIALNKKLIDAHHAYEKCLRQYPEENKTQTDLSFLDDFMERHVRPHARYRQEQLAMEALHRFNDKLDDPDKLKVLGAKLDLDRDRSEDDDLLKKYFKKIRDHHYSSIFTVSTPRHTPRKVQPELPAEKAYTRGAATAFLNLNSLHSTVKLSDEVIYYMSTFFFNKKDGAILARTCKKAVESAKLERERMMKS